MKFKFFVSALIVVIIGLFAYSIYLSNDISNKNKILEHQRDSLETLGKTLTTQKDQLNEYAEELASAVQSDQVYWEIAKNQKSVKAYLDFLTKFTDSSEYYNQAKSALDDKFKNAKTGFVQILDSDGSTKYFESVKSYSQDSKYYVAMSDRSVRKGVIGNSDYQPSGRTGDVILQGSIVRVLKDGIESGNSRWAQVRYIK